LAKKYLGKFFTCADIEKEKNIIIIKENQSVFLKCSDETVGAVICNATKKNVADHYEYKMKLTVEAHSKLNYGKKTHVDSKKLIRHNIHIQFLNPSSTMLYTYKEKS